MIDYSKVSFNEVDNDDVPLQAFFNCDFSEEEIEKLLEEYATCEEVPEGVKIVSIELCLTIFATHDMKLEAVCTSDGSGQYWVELHFQSTREEELIRMIPDYEKYDLKTSEMVECEYCQGSIDTRKNLMDGIYIDLAGRLSNDIECEDAEINYCPMCGRKLRKIKRKAKLAELSDVSELRVESYDFVTSDGEIRTISVGGSITEMRYHYPECDGDKHFVDVYQDEELAWREFAFSSVAFASDTEG